MKHSASSPLPKAARAARPKTRGLDRGIGATASAPEANDDSRTDSEEKRCAEINCMCGQHDQEESIRGCLVVFKEDNRKSRPSHVENI